MKRDSEESRPDDRSAQEKLRLVMEAAALSDEELGEFLRREGIHEGQLELWRAAALGALGEGEKKRKRSPERQRIKQLEKELNRKDKALAEVTALLALKKKLETLLGDEDDDTNSRNDD